MANAKGRLAEAYTTASGQTSKLTDLGFSYSARGEVTDAYESTPHSNGYYHSSATYSANGAPNTLSAPGLPTTYYCPDGEGRVNSVSTSSVCATSSYLASGVGYNVFGELTSVTYGSGDSDTFSV